jgi:hypothetical protein
MAHCAPAAASMAAHYESAMTAHAEQGSFLQNLHKDSHFYSFCFYRAASTVA